jgi:hypothetical protein
VAFLLHLGFVFTYDDGSVAIGVVVLVAEDLGFVTYRRLENIVRAYPADKFNLLDTNTEFLIKSEGSSDGALIIQASGGVFVALGFCLYLR